MLKWLLGIEGAEGVSLEGIAFQRAWPRLLLLALIVLAVGYAVWLYRRQGTVRPRRRAVMTLLRAAMYVLLVVMVFEPVFGFRATQTLRNTLLVLTDTSQSMGIEDPRKSDAQLVEAARGLGAAEFADPAGQRMLASLARTLREAAAEAEGAGEDAPQVLSRALEDAAKTREHFGATGGDEVLEMLAKVEPALADLRPRLQALAPERPEGGDAAGDSRPAVGGLLRRLAGQVDGATTGLAAAKVQLSPQLREQVEQTPRMSIAKGLIHRDRDNVFGELAKQYDVRYFAFDESLTPATGKGKQTQVELGGLAPSGTGTHLGSAIQAAVDRHSGQPIAGVVVLTDGASNGGEDPLEVAARMGKWGVPVYPVVLGLPEPDDLAVRGMMAPAVVFQQDRVSVRFQLVAHGFPGRDAKVALTLDGEVQAERRIPIGEGAEFLEMEFEVPMDRAGDARLAVAVETMEGEVAEENNRVARDVRILDEKIKVLYVEGKPRWEYRYLRWVLLRDHRLDVKFWMMEGDPQLSRASPLYVSGLPEATDEAFRYDLIILGDIDPNRLRIAGEQMQRVAELVREHTGALLVLAGSDHDLAGYANTPLADLLPVKPSEAERWVEPGPAVHPILTAAGRQSKVVVLEDDPDRNRELWQMVQPLYRLPAVEAKRSAHVLAELSDAPEREASYPLIAWQQSGTGKSMFVATDQLWRLRFKHGDEYHARFWGQAIQFLALYRLLGANQRVRIEVQPEGSEHPTGQRIEVVTNVLDERYRPSDAKSYTVYADRLSDPPEETPLVLRPVPGIDGLYRGSFTPVIAGRYEIRAGGEDRESANTVALTVKPAERETLEPRARRDLLEQMAARSGGRCLSISEVPALAGHVRGRTRTVTLHKERSLWDLWAVLALFLALGAVEWYLRRRSDMI